MSSGQARVLQGEFKHEKKPQAALSEASGTCERAAKNHLSGATMMNLKDFFNACQTVPVLRAWGARMMGLNPSVDPMFERELHGLIRTYYEIKDREEAAEA